jgi:hypothetical protein
VHAALGLAAVQRLARVEVLAHVEAAPVDLVEHLVGVLDEVLHALQELHREPVRPHHEARVPVQAEHLLQDRQVLARVVEQLLAVVEGPRTAG